MRIALVTHKLDFNDGQGRVNYELARAILADGHQLTLVAEECSDDIANHPQARFIQIKSKHLPAQLLRTLTFASKSARWLRQHRGEWDIMQANGFVTWEPADIVSVHFVHGDWLRNPNYPFRWKSLSPYAWYQRFYTLLNSKIERKIFSQARALIAVSDGVAKILATLPIPPKPISVIYNGVDVDEFHPEPGAASFERAAFGLPQNVPLVLFVGDIRTPRKNIGTVLNSMRDLPEVHLAVAGDTTDSPYPELAQQLGIANRVHFLGKVKRIPNLMRAVDLFVLPSRYETWGMVVLEAMASGLPVILSKEVGAAEFVSDICCVLNNLNDADELSTAMREILNSPDQRAAMAKAVRQRALETSWANMTAAYLKTYKQYCAVK